MRLLVLCYFLFSEKAFIEIERKLNQGQQPSTLGPIFSQFLSIKLVTKKKTIKIVVCFTLVLYKRQIKYRDIIISKTMHQRADIVKSKSKSENSQHFSLKLCSCFCLMQSFSWIQFIFVCKKAQASTQLIFNFPSFTHFHSIQCTLTLVETGHK